MGATLGEQAVRDLRDIKRKVDLLWAAFTPGLPSGQMIVPRLQVALTDGSGITAASGTTPGSGTVTLQTLQNGILANYESGGSPVTVTAYNFVETASGTSAYVFICQDVAGIWWLVAEAC